MTVSSGAQDCATLLAKDYEKGAACRRGQV